MNTSVEAQKTSTIWSNWNDTVRCRPRRIVTATTETEVQEAVTHAASANLTLRPAGGGHSFGPVVATDGIVLDVRMSGELTIDGARAVVPGGRRLYEIFEPLWSHNVTLVNMGELDTTALTGAIGTGVHGTGIQLPSISASLSAARLVAATGDVIELEARTDLMRAARVSMGMLGVMCETTIDVLPAYDLHETSFFGSPEQALEEWDELLHSNRHFSFYYLPNERATATYANIFPPVPSGTAGEICYTTIRNALEPGEGFSDVDSLERRDRMNRILTYTYPVMYREIEYAIPLDAAKRVFREVRNRLRDHHPSYAHPIDVRFVAQDDALLSWCHDGPKAIFSVPDSRDCKYDDVFADLEAVFCHHGGLPHWGKEHRLTAQRLKQLQPGFEQFREIRRELDPHGVFLNDHLRALFL
ncbi:D-arabinono-1,4-lactone oxidase [Allomesorhizobium camelthorni]|uniref:FAD-binding protein n=1 Tax=Allomesorhizobium camelthorni TaxID=475069 RepID=A0A6G4WM45_9HYPH|nr:D-arabinono-1,4-lactone oxidase [Mesorhizobium camelthorni]NGO55669.1 FAD-binding protein [Mesorhizobium camelthorni]